LLPKAPHETHLDKPHRVVGGSADVVVRLCVRGKLSTPLRAAPPLRRRDERPAHTAATRSRHNEPSLEIRHAIPLTSLGVRANRELGKADLTPCPVLGQ